uniref:Uncharacterized protein n=1 Tax=Chromera velia CCMP2878 TaxID=1169474 RepID=A0A0G4FJG3_9ALVE|eukprot:Cvel_17299.t1-p1 / transcript=Cvel_17299.t1 / gene=Cvel_17299 / organism=Chromera_velia_CCMP2878 / gene_product=hypothetical protein / transcript_product=hypothetical protein / location=Cvel_scaffold1373:24856-25893(-) / protein_length=256 / sequence_SO=supercontig / SO=protein_coding / is_pseudo=false
MLYSFTPEELGRSYRLFVAQSAIFKEKIGPIGGQLGVFHGGLLLVPEEEEKESSEPPASFTMEMAAIDWLGTLFPKVRLDAGGWAGTNLEFHPETEITLKRGVDWDYWEKTTKIGAVEGSALPEISTLLTKVSKRGLQYRAFEIRDENNDPVVKSSQCFDFSMKTARTISELGNGSIDIGAKAGKTNVVIHVKTFEEVDLSNSFETEKIEAFYKSLDASFVELSKEKKEPKLIFKTLGALYKDEFYIYIPGGCTKS